MQNFTPFWIFVTSRFINGLFRKNSHPLSDTKVDHYSDIQGDYWLGDRMFFFNTSWTTAINVRGFCLPIKTWKRMPMRRKGGNWKIAESERFFCLYPRSSISTCLVKSTRHAKALYWTGEQNTPSFEYSDLPFAPRMGLKVRQDEKMVTILVAF